MGNVLDLKNNRSNHAWGLLQVNYQKIHATNFELFASRIMINEIAQNQTRGVYVIALSKVIYILS